MVSRGPRISATREKMGVAANTNTVINMSIHLCVLAAEFKVILVQQYCVIAQFASPDEAH